MTSSSPDLTGYVPLSASQVADSTALFHLSPTKAVSHAALRALLPDIDTALFFAKVYELQYDKVSDLVRLLFQTSVVSALLRSSESHSTELQTYVMDTFPPDVVAELGSVQFGEDVQVGTSELLVPLWEAAEVEIAESIKSVAARLGGVLDQLSSKEGSMTFTHMRKLNTQRNSIGRYGASIHHERVAPRLVVLDVSGSVSESTVAAIVEEVVALSYKVDASLAIVSDNAYLWEAGTFTAADVLRAAEYSGTHYETLKPIFDRDWETVITIADYDSYGGVQGFLASHCAGRVGQVLDISLVNKVTFLAECVGRLANEVKPLLVGTSRYVLG